MKTTKLLSGLALFAFAACADESPTLPDGGVGSGDYKQIEQLARPGINEAFLLSNDFNAGYNATAPSFAGAPAEAVAAITAEAKTVMKALYLGACLANAVLSPPQRMTPAGITCNAIGGDIWTEQSIPNGVTLTDASKTKAQEYADKVFSQFIPDVMRIDTSAPSNYFTLCNDPNTVPLLCGGRRLNDDVIDITYNYLLAGAGVPEKGAYSQRTALVSDGVNFSDVDSRNSGNVISSTGIENPSQYHTPLLDVFPYSAEPY